MIDLMREVQRGNPSFSQYRADNISISMTGDVEVSRDLVDSDIPGQLASFIIQEVLLQFLVVDTWWMLLAMSMAVVCGVLCRHSKLLTNMLPIFI